ncbi:hypothetical protein CEXT_252661 [Caerostris extrusa]|uniref:Uncharacterized protein n=1 Tax=Caerostris extrusa TaxID=172846 RepID=A0AAV4MWL4_CAEEX|nr:hypothetical protein CEXT_252661 [Caerostris extrusa]
MICQARTSKEREDGTCIYRQPRACSSSEKLRRQAPWTCALIGNISSECLTESCKYFSLVSLKCARAIGSEEAGPQRHRCQVCKNIIAWIILLVIANRPRFWGRT